MITLRYANKTCALVEAQAPSPQPGQVLIRLKGTLLDDTHLQDFRLGAHQAPFLVCGEVLQPGAGVIGLRRGQCVLTICSQILSTYLLVDSESVIPTSQERSASCMLLGVALAMQALPDAERYPESTLISGAGFVGLALCALLQTTTPWIIGENETALQCAKELGATHCKEWGQLQEEQKGLKNDEKGLGAVLIETSGRSANIELAQFITIKGGSLVLAIAPGLCVDGIAIDATHLHYDQISWKALGSPREGEILAAQSRLEKIPDSLISDCLPFSKIEMAFEKLNKERGLCYLLSNDSDF